MANGYTNKGVKWELFQSIWVLFVFTPFGFLNWVSFFYIFARAKQKKWLIAGWIYFAIFLFTILSNGTPLFNAAMVLLIIGWGVSIVHALKVRPEFLIRLESIQQLKRAEIDQVRKSLKNEYPETAAARTSQTDKQSERKIDINQASVEDIASIPQLGIILAKKAVAMREEIGGFSSIDHFGEQLGLKPHVLLKVEPYLSFSKPVDRRDRKDENAEGRVLDI